MNPLNVILIGFFTIIVSVVIFGSDVPNQKLDRCIELANKIGLDPNDDKMLFIKECMN